MAYEYESCGANNVSGVSSNRYARHRFDAVTVILSCVVACMLRRNQQQSSAALAAVASDDNNSHADTPCDNDDDERAKLKSHRINA